VTRRSVASARVVAVRDGRTVEMPDTLATEEPLQITVDGRAVAVTMRTPGHDFELAVGWLLSEGVVESAHDVTAVRYCELPEGEPQEYNVVSVRLARAVDLDGIARRFTTTAACGVCGTATLDRLVLRCGPLPPTEPVALSTVMALPAALRAEQSLFDRTGGLHAAALFTRDGELVELREDVGRHNALDKLVGWALLAHRLPLTDAIVAVSGRLSYELVQKAAVAGVPVLCAVSAPSSLAVETARRVGMCVVGFVRDGRANVYTAPERLAFD
jgi:FdhD protein